MSYNNLHYHNCTSKDERGYIAAEIAAKVNREKTYANFLNGVEIEPYWDWFEREVPADDELRPLLHDAKAVEVEFEKILIGLDFSSTFSNKDLIEFVTGNGEPKSGLFELLVRNRADVENFDYYVNYYVQNLNPFLRATFVNYYPEYCDLNALANDPNLYVRKAVARQRLRFSEK